MNPISLIVAIAGVAILLSVALIGFNMKRDLPVLCIGVVLLLASLLASVAWC